MMTGLDQRPHAVEDGLVVGHDEDSVAQGVLATIGSPQSLIGTSGSRGSEQTETAGSRFQRHAVPEIKRDKLRAGRAWLRGLTGRRGWRRHETLRWRSD